MKLSFGLLALVATSFGELQQFTPDQADWSTFYSKPIEAGNTDHSPDGIWWLNEWATWDGIPFNPREMSHSDFKNAICPKGDVLRGIREVFYAHNPFADVANPTKAEVDEWHRISINHLRALVNLTGPYWEVEKDTCMFARALWGQQRRFTTMWDTDYTGTTGSAYGPCQGSGNSHCGATFVPNAADQAPYLPQDHAACGTPGGAEGVSGAPKSNIPWSVKWVRAICQYIGAETFWGGHVGPFFRRPKFGFSFWDPDPSNNGNNAIFRGKWTGSIRPVPYPKDCVASWGEAPPCSATCGGGVRSRTYTIELSAVHDGTPCEALDGEVRTETCSANPCPEACSNLVSQFTLTDGCDAGTNTFRLGSCQSATWQLDIAGPVVLKIDYIPDEAWNRHKSDTTTFEVAGNSVTAENRVAGSLELPVPSGVHTVTVTGASGTSTKSLHMQTTSLQFCEPCEGSWSEYTTCSATCGGGVRSRTFTRISPPETLCEGTDGQVETEACGTAPCLEACTNLAPLFTRTSGCESGSGRFRIGRCTSATWQLDVAGPVTLLIDYIPDESGSRRQSDTTTFEVAGNSVTAENTVAGSLELPVPSGVHTVTVTGTSSTSTYHLHMQTTNVQFCDALGLRNHQSRHDADHRNSFHHSKVVPAIGVLGAMFVGIAVVVLKRHKLRSSDEEYLQMEEL
eukprot:TRINITY_DN8674_c0_g1_i2.p1 TRINITY_DN8674_c0_g1~~TRINITY_DN8674_c0_g1_i2.p1  ORF type:complete len:700 (+),score=149.73 TRINITY_DN8674_c0_g1_i2:56-2101(+)